MEKITSQMVKRAMRQTHSSAEYCDYHQTIADQLNAELRAQHNAAVDEGFWRATAAAGVVCTIGIILALFNGDTGLAGIGSIALAILILVAYRIA